MTDRKQGFIFYYCALLISIGLKTVESRHGDACSFRGATGTCLGGNECDVLMKAYENNQITSKDIISCGIGTFGELVCCPNTDIFDRRSQHPTVESVPANPTDRPAERACKQYYAGTRPQLHISVLNGSPVDLGEYPHMAAIGFSQIGGNRSALAYNCGGTLIHNKFVLTAAHCLSKREQRPQTVRLGVTNFLDPVQMAAVVEKGIAKIHIHPDYKSSRKYNDIALLELESPVEFSSRVYPTCLYTEDTTPEGTFHVSGWGVTNPNNRSTSTQLLKAELFLQSLDICNATYTAGDIHRSIERGLLESQLCAYDPDNTKDACQGDSGGPLIMDVDISSARYRVVGIVSAGFDCGTLTPALYTRVYSFLDYIESIVWPSRP